MQSERELRRMHASWSGSICGVWCIEYGVVRVVRGVDESVLVQVKLQWVQVKRPTVVRGAVAVFMAAAGFVGGRRARVPGAGHGPGMDRCRQASAR